jgi:hypothetical protein
VAHISPKPALAPRPRPVRGVWIEIGCDGRSDSARQSPNDTDTAAVRCGSRGSVGVAQRCLYGPLPSNTNCSAEICRGQARCIRPPAAGRNGSRPCRTGCRSPCRSHHNNQAGPRRLSGLCAGHLARAEQRPRSPVQSHDTRPIPIQPGIRRSGLQDDNGITDDKEARGCSAIGWRRSVVGARVILTEKRNSTHDISHPRATRQRIHSPFQPV